MHSSRNTQYVGYDRKKILCTLIIPFKFHINKFIYLHVFEFEFVYFVIYQSLILDYMFRLNIM